jgi:hypothetical protein
MFCSAIRDCERHSWPQVQVNDLTQKGRDPGGSTHDVKTKTERGGLIIGGFLWSSPDKSGGLNGST